MSNTTKDNTIFKQAFTYNFHDQIKSNKRNFHIQITSLSQQQTYCCQQQSYTLSQQQSMKSHQKVLQLPSQLSKLIDSLCFQLSVNFPDENSLSLIEIIEWRKNSQISHEEFKELYLGWLESKNIYDLFAAKQLKTYPKQQLISFEGPVKNILTNKEITKVLQILNNAYNQIYIQKRVKGLATTTPKQQIKFIQDVEQLFSFLDSSGIINLRLSQLFFLNAALFVSQNKPIPPDFQLFQQSFKKLLQDLSEINGAVSLRCFKNYFLIQKGKPALVKTLNSVLVEIQVLSSFANESKSKSDKLPNVFEESLQKWKSYPRFRNKEKKIQFLKRVFQENQHILMFNNDIDSSSIQQQLKSKYGKDMMNVLQIDSKMLDEFVQILQDTLNKYLNLFQKIGSGASKAKTPKTQYINSSTQLGQDFRNSLQNSTNKKKMESSILESASKNLSKTAHKDRTPQKKRKNNNEFTASNNYTSSNNYRNRTPTQNQSEIFGVHREFGSAQKTPNGKGARQTTPTKSTLSFMTEAPKTYRAAQKRGLTNNNIYDKLFFFRNKRVESYEIVMKRLKNK